MFGSILPARQVAVSQAAGQVRQSW